MPLIHFTSHLKRFFPDLAPMERVEGARVADLLRALDERHPGIRDYLVDEQGVLRKHVNIFIGNRRVRDREALSDTLGPDDEVHVLQALSGG